MAGTKAGAIKARDKNLTKDPDFYRNIGKKGGATPTEYPKGFAANPELARLAGAKGGAISRRGPAKLKQQTEKPVQHKSFEKLYLKLRPWHKTHPNLSVMDNSEACPKCQSTDRQYRGYTSGWWMGVFAIQYIRVG